ncbi:SDR family oxidoreductase [Mesonia sp. K7]|uniref:SDR family NAD(P)-dependent oxidoreductase n=1 Tax=Mesonia sp. K7 TaxID=2218606 RepID=UPI000DA766C5|nr:SDR family oxidoreductase [Mesonia sp. K7]PZD77164.1 short-chain dehydrogenase [Mesonia sp. K7]
MSKKVVITGTSRGIGLALVKKFAQNGFEVLALSRNESVCKNLALANVSTFCFDLGKENAYQRLEEFVQNHWGGEVDILINNAGKLVNKPFTEIQQSELIEVYQTNVFGVFKTIQTLVKYMKKESHVVSISSIGGIQGSVKFAGLSAYSSSKAALINLTEMLAEEYKEAGPVFNCLALGAVQTEMLEEAFPGYQAHISAEEMANYIYDFSLNGQQYYNGKVLQVSNSTP